MRFHELPLLSLNGSLVLVSPTPRKMALGLLRLYYLTFTYKVVWCVQKRRKSYQPLRVLPVYGEPMSLECRLGCQPQHRPRGGVGTPTYPITGFSIEAGTARALETALLFSGPSLFRDRADRCRKKNNLSVFKKFPPPFSFFSPPQQLCRQRSDNVSVAQWGE